MTIWPKFSLPKPDLLLFQPERSPISLTICPYYRIINKILLVHFGKSTKIHNVTDVIWTRAEPGYGICAKEPGPYRPAGDSNQGAICSISTSTLHINKGVRYCSRRCWGLGWLHILTAFSLVVSVPSYLLETGHGSIIKRQEYKTFDQGYQPFPCLWPYKTIFDDSWTLQL